MKNKRIIIIIFICLGLLAIGGYLWLNNNKPAQHSAIRVNLKQLSENNLQIKELAKETIYPEEANQNPYLKSYYSVKIKDQKSNILFQTKSPKQRVTMFFSYPGAERPPDIAMIEDIVLYLPVYSKGDQIVITDENDNTIMRINLRKYLE